MADPTANASTILVIDDEASIRKVLQARLAGWGYRVRTAENGQEGLNLFEQERPQVVITDLVMPGMHGLEVLSRIAAQSPETPVIILSGQGEMGDAIRALRMGAWDYIYKPVEDLSFLRFSIESVLEKAHLITENRRHSEQLEKLVAEKSAKLVESEKRYRTVADFTHDWEYWIGPQGEVLYTSPSCERITGHAPAEIVANPALLHEMIHPDDRSVFRHHLDDNRQIPDFCTLDFRIVRRDGAVRWIGHRCRTVQPQGGTYQGRRCSNRDITYQKEMEHRLIEKKHDLINQTIRLERTNESLQQANAALKALLDQRETEKRSIEQTMVANLKRYVFPYLDDLEASPSARDATARQKTLDIIRTNIEQLVSPASRSLSAAYLDFTPTEVKVADLIRQGASTKEIADALHASTGTVAIHRSNIRKKLDLLNKKVNLRTYLNALA